MTDAALFDDLADALREQTAAIAELRAEVAALRRELRGAERDDLDPLGGEADRDADDHDDGEAWQRLGLSHGERRHVTVLFADVSGFTAMAELLDPEECRLVMVDTMAELAEIVARYGGHIEKFIGDAVCAIFGAPVAHADEPQRAVRAAMEMHRVMVERAAAHPDLPPLEVHIGINTGLVVAGGVGDGTQFGVVGDTINTAARLMDKAGAAQTFVSLETASRVRREFFLEDMGRHAMKGKQESVPVFSVIRPLRDDEKADARILRAPLTGRSRELSELVHAAREATTRPGVLVVGRAGIGKSRLLEEASAAIEDDGLLVLRASSRVLGAPPLELVGTALAPLGVDLQHDADPESSAVKALGEAAAQRPVAVFLDNVQYADDSSMALLESLVAAAVSAPVFWVLATRPDGPQAERVRSTMPWLEPLRLGALPDDATAEILTHLLHGALPEETAFDLARRTGGNAEFAEEIALALLDQGAVVQAGDGWRLTRELSDFEIPHTVHEMIEARIDALDTAAKTTLQDASVIGVRFSRALLGLVATRPSSLDAALAELVATELVRPPSEDDPWYSFRNPVVRDVAYGLLLHRRRPVAHHRVAEALLELHPGEEDENADMLAYHFEAAGDAEQAARYRAMSIATGTTTTGGTTAP